MNLQTGAFGDPAQIQTLILFWTKMELLHYPGAGETRAYLEEELHKQQLQQQMAMQMQMAQQQMQQAQMQQQQNGGLDMQTAQAVIKRAQQDAARDSGRPWERMLPSDIDTSYHSGIARPPEAGSGAGLGHPRRRP